MRSPYVGWKPRSTGMVSENRITIFNQRNRITVGLLTYKFISEYSDENSPMIASLK